MLQFLGVDVLNKNKFIEIYYEVFDETWGKNIECASKFIRVSWEKISNSSLSNNNTNGILFEYLIALCLYAKKILPFYMQAKLSFVPNAIYDIALYSDQGFPIILSAKTSLRERYKQADLEGWALKNVHRKAKNYLLTLNIKEAERLKAKIKVGDVTGIDEVILADTAIFDQMLDDLSHMNFVKPEAIEVITGKIVT